MKTRATTPPKPHWPTRIPPYININDVRDDPQGFNRMLEKHGLKMGECAWPLNINIPLMFLDRSTGGGND